MTTGDLADRITALEARMAALEAAKPRAQSVHIGPVDLDSQWGNPVIRKDPPRWTGESYVGRTYSDCPPDYLESLAGFLEWKAGKNEEDPKRCKYAAYDRKDAARARGWAERKRKACADGATPSAHGVKVEQPYQQALQVLPEVEDESDIPF